MTKLSIEVSPEFAAALQGAALDAGYKSTAEYVRVVLAEKMQVEHLGTAWGGKRQGEQLEAEPSEPVGQDAHVEPPKQEPQLAKVIAPDVRPPHYAPRQKSNVFGTPRAIPAVIGRRTGDK